MLFILSPRYTFLHMPAEYFPVIKIPKTDDVLGRHAVRLVGRYQCFGEKVPIFRAEVTFPETLVPTCKTTWRRNPERQNLHPLRTP